MATQKKKEATLNELANSFGIVFAENLDRPIEMMSGEAVYDGAGNHIGWIGERHPEEPAAVQDFPTSLSISNEDYEWLLRYLEEDIRP